MIFLVWLGIGAFVGWIACVMMHIRGKPNCLLNIGTGMGSALGAGMLINVIGNADDTAHARVQPWRLDCLLLFRLDTAESGCQVPAGLAG